MKKLTLTLLLISSICLTGCLSVARIQPNQYMLSVSHSAIKTYKPQFGALEIDKLDIAEPFSGDNFVYKLPNSRYEQDYYNVFFTSPDEQISLLIGQYFKKSHLFKSIALNGYPKPDYALQGKIMALYADYTNANEPTAVMIIKFIVIDFRPQNKNQDPAICALSKTFTASVPLQNKSTQALITAWNKALESILNQLSKAMIASQGLKKGLKD